MKSIIVFLILFPCLAFATVKSDISTLGLIAFGSSKAQKVKGVTAKEMWIHYFNEKMGEVEPERFVFKEIDEMAFGDEIDYGPTSLLSAKKMSGFIESVLEERLENINDKIEEAKVKKKIYEVNSNWAPMVEKLKKQGVMFGYDGHGPGYCGVSFVELLVLDPKTQEVYEVYLSESGEC